MTFLLRNKTIFFLIIFIGIIFRFYNLNFDDLWYDEIITLWVASPEHTWKESFEIHNKIELNSFIYHFFLKFFFNIFEYNEHLGRYLSATFGSASLLIIPMLLKELKLNNIRNFFIFLFSFNIFLISFSQEARLYSILFFFSILSFTYFLKIFNKKKKISSHLVFILVTTIAVILHPFALIILFSYCLFLLLKYLYFAEIFKGLNYSIILIITISLLFYIFFLYNLEFTNSKHYWISHPDTKFYTNLFFSKYFGSRLMGGIFLLTLIFLISKEFKLFKSLNILSIFLITIFFSYFLPILFGYIFKPALLSRYIIFILVPIIVLTSSLINRIENKKLKTFFFILLFSSTLLNQFTEQTVKQFFNKRVIAKPQYEKASNFIAESKYKNYIIRVVDMKSDDESINAIKNYINIINKKNNYKIHFYSKEKAKTLKEPIWIFCDQTINPKNCSLDTKFENYKILKEINFNSINLKLVKSKI